MWWMEGDGSASCPAGSATYHTPITETAIKIICIAAKSDVSSARMMSYVMSFGGGATSFGEATT